MPNYLWELFGNWCFYFILWYLFCSFAYMISREIFRHCGEDLGFHFDESGIALVLDKKDKAKMKRDISAIANDMNNVIKRR